MVNLRGSYDYDLEKTGLFGGINYDMIAQQPPSYVIYRARIGKIYIARPAPASRLPLVKDKDPLAVFSAVESILRDTGGSVLIRRADYELDDTLNLLGSNQTWTFEPGTRIISSASGPAIKIGNDETQVVRTNLKGLMGAEITRSSFGGTYAVHLENAHLCKVEGLKITNFSEAAILLEGSWGSQIERVEVPSNPGTYGVEMIRTRAGSYKNHDNNLVMLRGCWLIGTEAAVIIKGNPQMVELVNCDLHDSKYGLIADGGFVIDIHDNYFEANSDHDVYLRGSENPVHIIDIFNNFFGTSVAKSIIYVDNADVLRVGQNQVEAAAPGTIFVDASPTPSDKQMISRYV